MKAVKKKIIAAMKAAKENDYSNEGYQGKWLMKAKKKNCGSRVS